MKAQDYTPNILLLSPSERAALRLIAADPDTEKDTHPFTITRTGKYQYVMRRHPPGPGEKELYGSPKSILVVLAKLDAQTAPPTPPPPPIAPPPIPERPEPPILPTTKRPVSGRVRWVAPLLAVFAIVSVPILPRLQDKANNTKIAEATPAAFPTLPDTLPTPENSPANKKANNSPTDNSGEANTPAPIHESGKVRQTTTQPQTNERERGRGKLGAVFAEIVAATGETPATVEFTSGRSEGIGAVITNNLESVSSVLEHEPTPYPILTPPAVRRGPDTALCRTIRENLFAVGYRDGVLVFWAKDPKALRASFTIDVYSGGITGRTSPGSTGLAGWSSGDLMFTVYDDRVEVHDEVAK